MLAGWSAICLDGPASRMLDTCIPDLCSYPKLRNEANGIGYGLFRFNLRLQIFWCLRPLRHVPASGIPHTKTSTAGARRGEMEGCEKR